MSYRSKTYVAFASQDIHNYRLMTAWHANKNIDFNFTNAHDIYAARDSSTPETIRRRLRERLNNTKQVVLLGSPIGRRKGGNGKSFLAYEISAIISSNLPVVIANLDGSRSDVVANTPKPLLDSSYYTMSVAFGPTIIKYALDHYAVEYAASSNTGPYFYKDWVYTSLGLTQ